MLPRTAAFSFLIFLALILALPVMPSHAANATDAASSAVNATNATRPDPLPPGVAERSDDGRFLMDCAGVVLDTKTNQEWFPASQEDRFNWEEAGRWAAELCAAGGGWRLPSRAELRSLETEKPYPQPEEYLFSRGIMHLETEQANLTPLLARKWDYGSAVWSSEKRNVSSTWAYRYAGSRESWGYRGKTLAENLSTFAVRPAVPKPPPPSAKPSGEKSASAYPCGNTSHNGRFILLDSGMIVDMQTNLEWYPAPDRNELNRYPIPRSEYSFKQAQAWAAALSVDGKGWRLPTLSELQGFSVENICDAPNGLKKLTPLLARQWSKGSKVWSVDFAPSGNEIHPRKWVFDYHDGQKDSGSVDDDISARALAVRPRK